MRSIYITVSPQECYWVPVPYYTARSHVCTIVEIDVAPTLLVPCLVSALRSMFWPSSFDAMHSQQGPLCLVSQAGREKDTLQIDLGDIKHSRRKHRDNETTIMPPELMMIPLLVVQGNFEHRTPTVPTRGCSSFQRTRQRSRIRILLPQCPDHPQLHSLRDFEWPSPR